MRKFFYFLSIILIFTIGIYYVRTVSNAKRAVFNNADGTVSSIDVSAFEDHKILNINTNSTDTLSFKNSDYTLIIILSSGDCPNCLKERDIWNDFSKQYSTQKLQVIGILNRSSLEEAKTFTNAFNFTFPILFDENNQLGKATQLPQLTPFKILLKKDGEIIFADGPNPNKEAQKSFGEKLKIKLNSN